MYFNRKQLIRNVNYSDLNSGPKDPPSGHRKKFSRYARTMLVTELRAPRWLRIRSAPYK